MSTPLITVLLCTVRPDNGYVEHPEWHTIGKVVEDLADQTFQDFELVVVDGISRVDSPIPYPTPEGRFPVGVGALVGLFERRRVHPRPTFWTRHKKVAISTYRNTGLIHAKGELIVNLDDCCELPKNYLEAFAYAWQKYKTCLVMTWPGDGRPTRGRVNRPNSIYGFGSYPLQAAIELNGYDEAYDGGQGLEDVDWGNRLLAYGVSMSWLQIPGFKLHHQGPHDPRAIDLAHPIVKCCNTAWHVQRDREVQVANLPELWNEPTVAHLVGPCFLLRADGSCEHHHGTVPCAYLDRGWPKERSELCKEFVENKANWPIFDLRAEREKVGI